VPRNMNFDSVGINKNTGTMYDEDGYTNSGFDRNKLHKDTRTKYDNDGFNSSGYDRNYNTREDLNKIQEFITKTTTLPKVKLGLFDKFKMNEITKRTNGEILYEYVLTELEDDIKFKGLWAKAYANSEGDANKIEPLYMQYRVQAIKDRLNALEIAYNEMSKKALFEYIKNKF